MTHPGSKPSAPNTVAGLAALLLILGICLPPGLTLAQDSAEGARGPKAWTSYVNRSEGAAAPQEQAATQARAPSGQSPYLMAVVAFLLAGVSGAAGYYGARSKMGSEVADAVSKLKLPAVSAPPPPALTPRFSIELRGAEAIEGYGTLLVIEADGDFLVIFVDSAKGAATFLCRLSEAPSMGWRLDEIISGVVLAIRQGSPREAALAATRAIPREAVYRGEGSSSGIGQDEDLDVLLDELLGKVRGLKPAVKSDNEL